MGRVIILEETTKNPITLIGKRAGVCYGADVDDDKKNYERGLDCILSGHGRTLEYVNIEVVLEGYSARVMREWYTHIGCLPSRLQASTRYINYKNFSYVTPPIIERSVCAKTIYDQTMSNISSAIEMLEGLGVPKEDLAMLLPLGMETKEVDKRNLRNIVDMSRNRMCTRAYWEFRELFSEFIKELNAYSDEWKTLSPLLFMPKCEVLGYCPEKKSCGRKPKKETIE